VTSKWPKTQLGDVCQVIAGQSPDGQHYNDVGEGLPFYQGKKEFGFKFLGEPRVWTRQTTKSADAGDIVMSVRAPVGPVNIVSEKSCIGRGLAALQVKPELDRDFLYHFLDMSQDKLMSNEGTVFPSINKAQIEAIELPLPPLDEQKRIVAKLQEVLSAIEERRKLTRSKLEEIGSLSLHLLRNSFEDNAKVDESWKLTKLDDLFEFVNGRGFKTSEWKDVGLPIIRIQNLNNSLAPFNHFDGGYDEKILVKKGDLLYAWSGTVGSSFGAHVWQGTDGLLNQHIFKVNPKVEIDSRYARFALDSITADIELQVNGSVGLRHITKSKLLNFEIPFPPLDEQIKFVSRMDELESEIAELKETNTKSLLQMDKLQAVLLASAFVGEF
jgi:type I restriction enzyme S subunit